MRPGDLIDWAELTDRQAAEGDRWLRWRIARWARLAVARGAAITQSYNPFTYTTRWEARLARRTPDEQARAEATARRWERDARFDAENRDWTRWHAGSPREATR